MDKNEIGKLGEDRAVEFLIENSFKILERNYRYSPYEIDIIAEKEKIIHFVEVKTRNENNICTLTEIVNTNKQNFIIKAADNFLQEKEIDLMSQFDIIYIESDKIEFIQDAFQPN